MPKDFDYYIELEREAYLTRQRQRQKRRQERKTRMELRRGKRRRRILLALGLLAALLLALIAAPAAVSSPVGDIARPETEKPAAEPYLPAVAAPVAELGPAPEPAEPLYTCVLESAAASHYCICEKCCGKTPEHPAYGITASGRRAVPGYSVAVDPEVIPLDTRLYIDHGDGVLREYRADDTGSAIRGAKIDICVEDHETAQEMGVRTVAVYLAEE